MGWTRLCLLEGAGPARCGALCARRAHPQGATIGGTREPAPGLAQPPRSSLVVYVAAGSAWALGALSAPRLAAAVRVSRREIHVRPLWPTDAARGRQPGALRNAHKAGSGGFDGLEGAVGDLDRDLSRAVCDQQLLELGEVVVEAGAAVADEQVRTGPQLGDRARVAVWCQLEVGDRDVAGGVAEVAGVQLDRERISGSGRRVRSTTLPR